MEDMLEFYSVCGKFSGAGGHSAVFDSLPGDVRSLCRVVQGVMLHIFWATQYGVELSAERQGEVGMRAVSDKLARILELDPRPLTATREPELRLVGNCRDFSLLLTAILRHQGVPARARCGFGRYFIPGHYEDHWVCEYWNSAEKRWVLVDAQLDALQVEKLGIQFDPLDVPRDQFIVGGRAWQMCRSGQADPDHFGIFDMHGLWFVRGDFVRDVAALNKMELLPWDGWGLIDRRDEELSADDLAALDEMAELTAGAVPEFGRMRALYLGSERWRVPDVIHSYTAQGVSAVEIGKD